MKAAYESAKQAEPALSGYDRWFAQQPNNAATRGVGIYTDRVPAFRELLHESNGNLPAFYDACARSRRSPVMRARRGARCACQACRGRRHVRASVARSSN